MEYEDEDDTNCNWCIWNGSGLQELEIEGRNRPNYRIVKIGWNTEKTPRDLKRLAVAQTLLKDHQLRVM